MNRLVLLGGKYIEEAVKQYYEATNFSDKVCALLYVCENDVEKGEELFLNTLEVWRDHPLKIKNIFVQSSVEREDILERVKELQKHEVFDKNNQTHIHVLIGGISNNLKAFHQKSGAGYKFLADNIIDIDSYNSSMAARLSKRFSSYPKLPENLKQLMKTELERILSTKDLSKTTYEIVSKTLNAN